jgi:hypothetical protein
MPVISALASLRSPYMPHAPLSQHPTLLGDVCWCGQGIRLPGVPRTNRMLYARADAERTHIDNSELERYLGLQSIRFTGRANTLTNVRSLNIDQSRQDLGYSEPPFSGRCLPFMRLSHGHATGGLTVGHGSQRTLALESTGAAGHVNASNSAFASCRSAVLKPSVNQL